MERTEQAGMKEAVENRLVVFIYRDDERIDKQEFPDPRIKFVEEFNQRKAAAGLRASLN